MLILEFLLIACVAAAVAAMVLFVLLRRMLPAQGASVET